MEGNPYIFAISFGDYLAGAAPAGSGIGAAFGAFGKTVGRYFIALLPYRLHHPGLASAPASGVYGGWFSVSGYLYRVGRGIVRRFFYGISGN